MAQLASQAVREARTRLVRPAKTVEHGSQRKLKRVLLIDDHDDTRELVALVLERAGYSVFQASQGQQGLDLLVGSKEELPRLILLDLQMPVMSGWEFLTIIRSYARLAAIPVIVMSGSTGPAESLRDATIAGYLAKPVDYTALLARVKQVVAD
jgi:CheY-like chemotaxis protein